MKKSQTYLQQSPVSHSQKRKGCFVHIRKLSITQWPNLWPFVCLVSVCSSSYQSLKKLGKVKRVWFCCSNEAPLDTVLLSFSVVWSCILHLHIWWMDEMSSNLFPGPKKFHIVFDFFFNLFIYLFIYFTTDSTQWHRLRDITISPCLTVKEKWRSKIFLLWAYFINILFAAPRKLILSYSMSSLKLSQILGNCQVLEIIGCLIWGEC